MSIPWRECSIRIFSRLLAVPHYIRRINISPMSLRLTQDFRLTLTTSARTLIRLCRDLVFHKPKPTSLRHECSPSSELYLGSTTPRHCRTRELLAVGGLTLTPRCRQARLDVIPRPAYLRCRSNCRASLWLRPRRALSAMWATCSMATKLHCAWIMIPARLTGSQLTSTMPEPQTNTGLAAIQPAPAGSSIRRSFEVLTVSSAFSTPSARKS